MPSCRFRLSMDSEERSAPGTSNRVVRIRSRPFQYLLDVLGTPSGDIDQ
jgi:hypothetical protein